MPSLPDKVTVRCDIRNIRHILPNKSAIAFAGPQ
eukprot:COSAG02_NODE_43483_length_374_cov_0.923636_1_plen_33_part_10